VRVRVRSRRLAALLLAVPIGFAAITTGAGPAPAAAATVVSLTYDDSVADVYQAGAMMSQRGMKGTFFVNSGRIGTSGYLSRAQLDALAADGHEIGGHTVSHADLATLSDDEARRQICNDRSTLLSWGYQVRDFAYPFGSLGSTSQAIAKDCGYNSARQVGDIAYPGGCTGCATAETIPPANPYYTRAPGSVRDSWTVADLQGLVTQAEASGGGWVQVVFHHVCDGCDSYGVSPTVLAGFLDWLKGQVDGGAAVVRTVDSVIGGPVQPAVTGPPPPPPPPPGTNELQNPGLEDSANGSTPTCWQQAGFGTNTASFSRVNGAHAGSWAEQVKVTTWSDGDRKLLPAMDLGQCSPGVTAGHTYTLSTWYTADVPVPIVSYYRTTSGGWVYWLKGPVQPASSTWRQATWTPPAVPAGATAVSFGLSLAAVGTVTTDDYALVDVTQPPDTAAPTASLTAPTNGATLTGPVTFSATAADNVGVTRVDFAVDGTVVASTTSAPYQLAWSSDQVANGTHTVSATAYDAAGHASAPSTASVTTSNTGTNPVVNPSLEKASTSVPDCFQVGVTGTNTGTAARTSTARTGSWAEQVTVTSRTSGDRKLVTKQDTGTCAPAVTAGRSYQVSAWYMSDVPVPFVVYYRNASGAWVYWQTGPNQPASSSWRQAVWTTPVLPAGATQISFGLALAAVGTLTTDDYAIG
jgi:peptidoglycan/xylan/chitin deacetylase (PgdA/CDA1 family)